MARDVSETVRDALGGVVREALKNAGDVAPVNRERRAVGRPGLRHGLDA